MTGQKKKSPRGNVPLKASCGRMDADLPAESRKPPAAPKADDDKMAIPTDSPPSSDVILNAIKSLESSLRNEIAASRLEIVQKIQRLKNEIDEVKAEQTVQHKRLKDGEVTQHALTERVDKAEEAILNLERYSRNFNALFFGFEEEPGELCKEKVKDFIRQVLKTHDPLKIEMAHRLGAKSPTRPKPRPIIVKFLYREEKSRVIITGRKVLRQASQYITEDLPKEDLATKRRLAPVMKAAYDRGDKVSFRGGKLYINGRECSRSE